VRDETDNGSIVDFIQHRRRCTLSAVRRELRPWTGGAVSRPALGLYVPELVPVSRNRAGVLRALAEMKPLVTHRYVEEDRAIPRELLAHPRSNVIFAHADRDGPCGYEIKNRHFTGFAPGGEKGLWVSGVRRTDTALVLAESAIDALSYPAPPACPSSLAGAYSGWRSACRGSSAPSVSMRGPVESCSRIGSSAKPSAWTTVRPSSPKSGASSRSACRQRLSPHWRKR
jgi:hypothetical protein